MKFRKKPVVIDALQLTSDSMWEVYGWIEREGGRIEEWCWDLMDEPMAERYIKISTLEGVMTASEGDWVIKGVKGEFYPCKPDIFEASYESAE